jgi:hypothetical protein
MFLYFGQKGVETISAPLVTVENRMRKPEKDIVTMRKDLSRD